MSTKAGLLAESVTRKHGPREDEHGDIPVDPPCPTLYYNLKLKLNHC